MHPSATLPEAWNGCPRCRGIDAHLPWNTHWIDAVGAKTAFIEPGSPWENGYCESFNSKLRDELLNGEISTRWPKHAW